MAQSRTDELRELLERYPAIDRTEVKRARLLLGEASATEFIAMISNDELCGAVHRIKAFNADAIEVIAIVVGCALACILLYFVIG